MTSFRVLVYEDDPEIPIFDRTFASLAELEQAPLAEMIVDRARDWDHPEAEGDG